MSSTLEAPRRPAPQVAAAFVCLVAFYLLTAPNYHTTAIDSYSFAWLIEDATYAEAPIRLFLWIISMHGLYDLVSLIVPGADVFAVAAVANAVQTAAAVILLERLLALYMGLSLRAALLTAAVFAVSYGTWRYATELEVYATSAFLPLVLLHLAFGLKRPVGTRALVGLAAAGTVATLFYQPIGILAGIAIPVFLLLRTTFRPSVIYLVVYSAFVGAGLELIRLFKYAQSTLNVRDVLDTDGKLPHLPTLGESVQAAVAFFQNLLSANWVFAFGPTRNIIATRYEAEFVQELVATQSAHWTYYLFAATVPVAAALCVAALVLALRRGPGPRSLAPHEACAAVWLAIHAVMALSLDPTGFEAWLPAIVPLFLLIGTRICEPLVASGRGAIVLALIPVFLVHNWFAGVALFGSAQADYNRLRGDALRAAAGPGDLLVAGDDWPFERYFNYTSDATSMLVWRDGVDVVTTAVAETLARGGKVFILDNAVTPIEGWTGPWPDFGPGIDTARKIDLAPHGYALEVSGGS